MKIEAKPFIEATMDIMKPLNIEKGEIENKDFRRCTQVQCGYYQDDGCKACSDCKAPSLVLKKSCNTCYNCENVPDELRFNDPNINKNDLKKKKKIKEAIMKQFVEEELLPIIEESTQEEPEEEEVLIIR